MTASLELLRLLVEVAILILAFAQGRSIREEINQGKYGKAAGGALVWFTIVIAVFSR